ncbi:MAG: aminoacyl-tRNA hydrolase [Bdellovibrionales bacterium]|nr:aminoacyl-tRNA hydrolase [Bdellovibrionales bacterium]
MRKFFVGLGNPGSEYEHTRHNIGFLLVDRIANAHSVGGGAWKEKFSASFMDVSIEGERVTLVKPQSYMNRSGEPLQQLMEFFKIPSDEIVIIHDEVDLPFGTVRLKLGGGEGGHNGLKSISSRLGTKQYLRLRLGVGRPPVHQDESSGREFTEQELSGWVLGRFGNEEARHIETFLDNGIDALRSYLKYGLKRAQNEVHSK